MLEHDAPVIGTKRSGGQDIFLVLESVELHSHSRCHAYPSRQYEGIDKCRDRSYLTGKMQVEQNGDDHERYSGKNVGKTFHYHVNGTAIVTFNGTVYGTDAQVDYADQNGQKE